MSNEAADELKNHSIQDGERRRTTLSKIFSLLFYVV